jgi:glucans biosynthesis protein
VTIHSLSRRGLIGAALASPMLARDVRAAAASPRAGPPLGRPVPFSFDRLKAAAASSARRPYLPPPAAADLSGLDFDAVGRITYRPSETLWGDLPGDAGVRLFPRGRYAAESVKIHAVEAGQAREVLYAPRLFDVADPGVARLLAAAPGFSGVRAMNPDRQTDWLAFQGASYFRSADPFNQYGLSARGLAINAGGPGPESFPRFSEFWLERTPAGELTVYAALEGEEVAGAYRFVSQRGSAGLVQEVDCALFFRKPVEHLGIAPLTSMFWYGENDPAARRDWRPEIHDSDGLAVWTGAGERLWRPLTDPPRVVTNSFADLHPRGFGLLQRDRAFDHYQDDGAFYDRRPSAWVEPLGDWGRGSVELVEIPTDNETSDNIVAFWRPAEPAHPGDARSYRYRLNWIAEAPAAGVARAVATRAGFGGRPGQAAPAGVQKLVVDFEGGDLAGLTRQSGVEPVVSVARGRLESAFAYPVVGTSTWRLMIDVTVVDAESADLRAFLRRSGGALTETWTYQVFAR